MKNPVDTATQTGPATPDFILSNINTNLGLLPGDITQDGNSRWQDSIVDSTERQVASLVEIAPERREELIAILGAQATRLDFDHRAHTSAGRISKIIDAITKAEQA